MNTKTLAIIISIFLINPFAGMLIIILIKMMFNKKESKSDLLLFLFIVIYASLLQSTRIWNTSLPSDWNGSYLELFNNVKSTSASTYILLQKEPVWNLLNYIGYYINNGSAYLFLNQIAIVTIFLTATSIYIYWKSTHTNPVALIASLAFIIFLTEYFGQLNNLLRQYFSLSIVVYAYVRKMTFNKPGWHLLIIASLVHSLSFIFLFIYFVKPVYKKISLVGIMRLAVVMLGISFISTNIALFRNIFSKIQFLAYGFDRLLSAGNPVDQNLVDSTTVFFNALILILAALIFLSNRYIPASIVFFRNILVILMLLSISLVSLAPEIMGRLYVSRFYIFPFVLPYFLMNKKIWNNAYTHLIAMFFLIRFFLTFDSIRGGGFFPPISELLTYSVFHFIF